MNRYKIGEFSKLTGVSIKALRYYDRIKLLIPEGKPESGYRIYNTNHIFRLEQIIAFKFLGLSLREIKNLLSDNNVEEILAKQKEAIELKIKTMQSVLQVIDKAENNNTEMIVPKLINIIRELEMEKSKEWIESFYSEEKLQQINNRPGNAEKAKAGELKWAELIKEIRMNIEADPASPVARELAKRWFALIEEFTQGDKEISDSLQNVYANTDKAPAEFKNMVNSLKDVMGFINKAAAAKDQ